MTATATTLPTENESWGFFGTMGPTADAAWPLAFEAVQGATACDAEDVRAFLDSTQGRHFADTVHCFQQGGEPLAQAVSLAVQRWMGWRITRATAKTYGVPVGVPYLTAFVVQAGIESALA